ncbi:MAG: hypothetical protein WBW33_32185, partial [Bryobacteraceae bacterium]
AKLHVGRTDDSDARWVRNSWRVPRLVWRRRADLKEMWITSTQSFTFPKPDCNPDHPLSAEVAKHPHGFRIEAKQTKDAPEWIMQTPTFEMATKAGLLEVKDSGEPQLEWRIPESVEGNPAYWRSFADEFLDLQRRQDALSPSKRQGNGLVAYSTSGGAEGSGLWELHCSPSHIQEAFAEIAARGSKALGVPSVDPVSCWLSQTWLYLRTRKYKQKYTCRTETGACILGVIEASAALCSRLARDVAEMNAAAAEGEESPGAPVTSSIPTMLPAQERQILEEHRQPKKPARRSAKYEMIDETLREIADACPKDHAEVFRLLDEGKVAVPNRKPFKAAGGWLKGFQRDRHSASVWLSQAWGKLRLPAFPPGPKK